MFLKDYETRRISFDDGAVWVTKFPTGEYGACPDETTDGKYIGFGPTVLSAIADMVENLKEK
jgi:hypothetical protein